MRQITLSDHVNEQAAAAAQRRQADYDEAQGRYLTLKEDRKRRSAELNDAIRTAWVQRRFLAWVACHFRSLVHDLSSEPTAPRLAEAQKDEVVFMAGAEGERKVVSTIASQLDNNWVAISGYKNPAGEIDLVVVGPPGVMAIEVKYLNGKVGDVPRSVERVS